VTEPLRLPGNQCEVHRSHWPPVLETVVHHIRPTSAGGGDVAENRVKVCDTGHRNIHAYLRALARGRPTPKATRRERQLATLGFLAWVEAGKPGRIV
jgi:hypothetical protein